ncbi:BZ3500_MvSof-1268-A1-R1_Chr2-1g04179 [Microbotryum saponariae]|uniref:BZ3500_MvSof-1268-A1-R1_Chr2-1g04179 protein n=1 Tax=Microbotryum saponariae TaxID=289078 RepID=A0A2X0KJJ0_9BASI|nr:BZ3500_MvSof-1268-A1-R1_Chr2-1g04179 [Microbotryum saponariae]SCZ91166.1 BZ3501_MvSof-1269-A2-R1_Chr2-1g03835 [Microbotryum saponariae]
MRLVFVVALVIVCSTLIAAQQTLKQNQATLSAALKSCRCRQSHKCKLDGDSPGCSTCDKTFDSPCQSASIVAACVNHCIQKHRKFKDRFDCITKDFQTSPSSTSPISCGVFGYSLDAFNSCLLLSKRRPQRAKEALALVSTCNDILNYGPMKTSPPEFDL